MNTIIQTLINRSNKQNLPDGTEVSSFAGRISTQEFALLKGAASLQIDQIGHYTKDGKDYTWVAIVTDQQDGSVMCKFTFSDYEAMVLA